MSVERHLNALTSDIDLATVCRISGHDNQRFQLFSIKALAPKQQQQSPGELQSSSSVIQLMVSTCKIVIKIC